MTRLASKDPHEGCPLRAVDRRLEDLHRQWHVADDAYFDPEGFRVAIQTAIQTLRTVTFILQSNKALIPDFDAWYAGWQKKMGDDPLMVWMRDARNKIEKQGDLEAHSTIRAQIIASYLDEGPRIDVPAKLADAPVQLLKSIPASALGEHIWKNGVLRIERRWVENTLPEYELLDAVAIAYGRVAQVLADAHRQLGLEPPTTTDITTGLAMAIEARASRAQSFLSARFSHDLSSTSSVSRGFARIASRPVASRLGSGVAPSPSSFSAVTIQGSWMRRRAASLFLQLSPQGPVEANLSSNSDRRLVCALPILGCLVRKLHDHSARQMSQDEGRRAEPR
jgi:hypothetical protein